MEANHWIQFGKNRIYYDLEFKRRKSLGISVLPNKSVEVHAPLNADIDIIKRKIFKRAPWILKQQRYFSLQKQNIQSKRYVSGEEVFYLGKQFRLKVVKSDEDSVKLKSGYLIVNTNNPTNTAMIKRTIDLWYLEKSQSFFNQKLDILIKKFKTEKPNFTTFKIRKMSKRWGSCTKRGQIFLNPDLIKKPTACIEYVILHELCHLIEYNHSRKFYALLFKLMPDWKERKRRLEGV